MAEKQYTLEQIKEAKEIAAALGMSTGEKHDVFSTTLTNQSLYNFNPGNTAQYGLFQTPGGRPGIWNATAHPRTFTTEVPFEPTTVWQELLDIMTGVTATTGTNSTSSCAAAPTPGVLKTMRIPYTFGIINMDTRTFDVTQVGAVNNRSVMKKDIYNQKVEENPFVPNIPGIAGDNLAGDELRAALYALGVAVERAVGTVNFTGVAATEDNAVPGIARQWAGLDALIKTGYTDSVTGLAAAVVDSDIQTFNANVVGGSDAFSRDIVDAINDLIYGLRERARQVASATPTHALIMRGDLFRQITRIWAEQDAFYHVTGAAGTPISVMGSELQNERREMQRGRMLILDDDSRIPVIIDDTIERRTMGNNFYSSDIYVVAMEWGGVQTLKYQFFNMANTTAEDLASFGTGSIGNSVTINNGLYRLFRFETGGCTHWKIFARPRLILDAPFVHGKLQGAQYNSYYKQQDPLPGMSFHRNGGRSYNTSQF